MLKGLTCPPLQVAQGMSCWLLPTVPAGTLGTVLCVLDQLSSGSSGLSYGNGFQAVSNGDQVNQTYQMLI